MECITMMARGFEFTPGAEGKPSTFTDPLAMATFTVGEVKPNGEAVRPQLEAAITRTEQQAQARSQEQARNQGRGLSR
jgi:hypothetical protein